MSSPSLTRKLELQTASRIADGAGGFSEAWQTLGTLWADVKPRAGRSAALGEVAVSTATHGITVRGAPVGAPSRPTPSQRFLDGVRAFRIVSVTEADRNGHYLLCQTVEETAT
ncbi:MAG: head-tail adaptor protein [Mangrovicoccus sp.]